jgi:hypothetical protein
MSHAYEALTNRLQKLDKWITETERLATLATDPAMRLQISNDLARWRESRRECAALLTRIKWMNRAVSTTMTVVIVSFVAMLILAILGPPQSSFSSVLLAIDYLALFTSTLAFIPVVALRDAVARGGKPWQFSLARVLAMMTGVAIVLGILAWLIRR